MSPWCESGRQMTKPQGELAPSPFPPALSGSGFSNGCARRRLQPFSRLR
jgi:hypothetical protein